MSKLARSVLLSCVVLAISSCNGSVERLPGVPAVLLGASIIENWQYSIDFASLQWIDKGISGQKCREVRARVQQDVVALHPVTLHLLCGTNDILSGNTSPEVTHADVMDIVAQARAANISVILATLPPVRAGVGASFGPDTPQKIIDYNTWMRNYAHDENLPLADYYNALVGDDGQMVASYTFDGIHPSLAGYKIMTPILIRLLEESNP
jgi:Lysophospholipase L1 and related esterases